MLPRILAVALLSTLAHAQQPTPLAAKITTLLAGSQAHWGIAVTALDGTPLYGLDEARLFRPASSAKLFTTAAAMALLKPDATFTTRIYGKPDATTGTVSGDLILLGGGDPSFASSDLPYAPHATRNTARPLADLEALADQIKAQGVTHITGNIVGDDTLFPYQPYGESWAADDLVWGYGAPVSALSIADNQLKLTITPNKIHDKTPTRFFLPATLQFEQFGLSFYTIQDEVDTLPPTTYGLGIQVERLPNTHTLRVYGAIANNAPPDVEYIAIDDPAAFAAQALRQMLLSRGITVDGTSQSRHKPFGDGRPFLTAVRQGENPCDIEIGPPPGKLLASHTSAPLAQDVAFTLKLSQNLHAEIFLHQLGLLHGCSEGTTSAGAQARNSFLAAAGLDPNDFIFYDGSGLSAKDLVTPRATAKLLSFATTQPWFAQWKVSLPIGGVDGTLSNRFTAAPLKGHVFAKTGTLGESRALSGYLDCASGKQVIFSILVDNHLPNDHDRDTMDKIVAAIASTQ